LSESSELMISCSASAKLKKIPAFARDLEGFGCVREGESSSSRRGARDDCGEGEERRKTERLGERLASYQSPLLYSDTAAPLFCGSPPSLRRAESDVHCLISHATVSWVVWCTVARTVCSLMGGGRAGCTGGEAPHASGGTSSGASCSCCVCVSG
jgi:hypothetical protein